MAVFTATVRGDDVQVLISELNALLATLTTHTFIAVELLTTSMGFNRPPMWDVLLTYENGYSATAAFVAEGFSAANIESARAAYQAWRVGYPTEFLSAPIAENAYNNDARTHNGMRTALIIGVRNLFPANADRWPQVSGGAGSGGGGGGPTGPAGGSLGGTYPNPTIPQLDAFPSIPIIIGATVVDSIAIATTSDMLWEIVAQKGNVRYSLLLRANHDGTVAYSTQTETVLTPGTVDIAFSADVSGGLLRLISTASSLGWDVWYRRRYFPI